jgi:tetratricopeptide (TPR) repeat protein
VLGNLGSIANSQGQLAQAERWCLEAAELTRRLDDREGTVANVANVGEVETQVGRYERAEVHLAEALELARSSGSAAFVTTVLSRQSLLAVERGDPGLALARAEEATATAHDAPSPLEQGAAAIALGYAHQALGSFKDAAAAFDAARAAYTSIDRPTLLREADAGLAAATLAADPDGALERVRPILDHVNADGLIECLRPTALLHNLWLVLDLTGDPAVAGLLADATAYRTGRAEAIGDDEMAAGYLARPIAAELLRLAEDRASRLA